MSADKYENVGELMDVFQKFARADWRKKTMWGLKASELRVLVGMKTGSDRSGSAMTVSEISKALQVTSPTVTQMVNSLIASGYVERSSIPKDRRISEVRLTERGDQLAQKAAERYRDLFMGMIDHLGKERSDALVGLLNDVFRFLERSADLIERQ
ncbi:MarR family winged helix-turn-helix transcriptional regulator [Paenibacillus arenilitoris]|uniref:MarR family transcriptional regulator n=1 Tax=Paenibacillus arenilitoris TaxID=2772299 RepID=A0A927CI08_9BACL|nr:MarR family transcriptional regulator [Paenibacillus arenilitoris]MBD2867417.1 MarR family transcriptional regulator [Paenibacillus arenilitoris]